MAAQQDQFGWFDPDTGERWDHEADIYTRRVAGVVAERRTMTDAERALYGPPVAPLTIAEIAAEFANIESVADAEAFRAALEGLA